MSFVDDHTDYNPTANANDLINTTALAAARLCTAAFQHGLKPHPEKDQGHPHTLRRGGQEGETADSQGGRTCYQGVAGNATEGPRCHHLGGRGHGTRDLPKGQPCTWCSSASREAGPRPQGALEESQ
eukprot:2420310-Pyramimonas_sp.AAC.1